MLENDLNLKSGIMDNFSGQWEPVLPEIGICSNWIHGFRTISPDDDDTPSNKVTIQKTKGGIL